MAEFKIDQCIKDWFELYSNVCSHMSEHYDSSFEKPATLEEIEKWEKDNDTKLPHQYISWLLLASEASIMDEYLVFTLPELGSFEEDNDVINIGTRMGDGEEIGIFRSTGKFYTSVDGETENYNTLDDLLDSMLYYMEDKLEECFGENWAEDFNKKFGY